MGEDGAHAAWFILQHAIGNPPLQAAYLEDRTRFFEGRPSVVVVPPPCSAPRPEAL